MAKGDIVYSTRPTSVMNKIQEMRNKWGISTANVANFPVGGTTTVAERNKLIDYLNEGKSKSGWTGTVPAKINANELLTDAFDALLTAADSIKSYCACNCNYCSCDCNRCGCNCNRCCNDGSDGATSKCVDWSPKVIIW